MSQVARGFSGLAVLEKTFAAAELVGGSGQVFYSLLENIYCVMILLEWTRAHEVNGASSFNHLVLYRYINKLL